MLGEIYESFWGEPEEVTYGVFRVCEAKFVVDFGPYRRGEVVDSLEFDLNKGEMYSFTEDDQKTKLRVTKIKIVPA